LATVFGLVSKLAAQKRREDKRWIVPAFYAMAVVCVVGGLVLAYHRESNISASLKPRILFATFLLLACAVLPAQDLTTFILTTRLS
jgi:uncharacterized membrane protein